MKPIIFLICASILILPVQADQAGPANEYQQECQQDLEQVEQILQKLENIEGKKTVETVLIPLNELERMLAIEHWRDISFTPYEEITEMRRQLSQVISDAPSAVD